MNLKTHKITEGAMYLAIAGALMILNRTLSAIFDVYIPLFLAVIIILYTTKYDYKDGLVLSFGIFVLSFLFGNIYLILYNLIGIISGLAYGYGANRGYDRRLLLLIVVVVFVIGEFLFTISILPLFGYNTLDEMYNMITDIASSYGLVFSNGYIRMIYGLTIFFTGATEGLIIHLLAIVVLRKLKIKILASRSLDHIKMPPLVAYISLALVAMMFILINYSINTSIAYFVICLGLISSVLLIAQGYIFSLLYGIIVYKRNITLMLVGLILILMPVSFLILIIIGFLYATGPLERYLKKRGMKVE